MRKDKTTFVYFFLLVLFYSASDSFRMFESTAKEAIIHVML